MRTTFREFALLFLALVALHAGRLFAQTTVGFHQAALEVSEANDFLLIPLNLLRGLDQPAEVSYSTESGTALAGLDFVATNGVLQLQPGEHFTVTNRAILRIPLLRDVEREATETFFVRLEAASGGLMLGSITNLEVRIVDNDQGVRFSQDTEAQTLPGTVELEVLRGDDGDYVITVDYTTVAGSALPGSDYEETRGTLTFNPGQASRMIYVKVAENDVLETDEVFTVELSEPRPISLGSPSKRTVRILNGQPTLLTPLLLAQVPFPEPEPNKQAVSVALQGDYLYTVYGLGFSVCQVTNSSITQIADLPLPGHAQGIEVTSNHAFVTTWSGPFLLFDISDPARPISIASLDIGPASRLRLADHYAYVAAYQGLTVVDFSDPLNPVLLTNQPTGGAYTTGVALDRNLAVVAAWEAGLQVYDLSTPARPVLIGRTALPGIAQDVAVLGNHAYVTGGRDVVSVVSIDNPAQPKLLARLAGPPGLMPESITIAPPYAYVTDYGYGLWVLNIAAPAAPYLVASYQSRSFDVAVRNHLMFLADTWSGLKLLSIPPILDPSVPQGEGFQFLLRSLVGLSVRIERSSDCENWEFFKHLIPGGEVTRITDAEPGAGKKFYRAVVGGE